MCGIVLKLRNGANGEMRRIRVLETETNIELTMADMSKRIKDVFGPGLPPSYTVVLHGRRGRRALFQQLANGSVNILEDDGKLRILKQENSVSAARAVLLDIVPGIRLPLIGTVTVLNGHRL